MSSNYRVNYQLRAHKRDAFIEFIKAMLMTPFVLHAKPRYDLDLSENEVNSHSIDANEARFAEILLRVEELVEEHRRKTSLGVREHSQLYRLVPSVGNFFTSLPLKAAFLKVNAEKSISARRFVPPSFNDIRKILNVAQVQAIAANLKLVTFDGDMTLCKKYTYGFYSFTIKLDDDGQDFEQDSELVALIIELLKNNINVAVVTAAGYGEDAKRYEGRLLGLLKGFSNSDLTSQQKERFFVFGGECNYLFQCTAQSRLEYIHESSYLEAGSRDWPEEHITSLLDLAEKNIRRCVEDMKLSASILRKSRAVGLIPKQGILIGREQLDECVLSTQAYLHEKLKKIEKTKGNPKIPFCAFNGGSDVWVDIGNKLIGVDILQKFLGTQPDQTLHFGDQFLSTGNDFATRSACCTSWIISPEETRQILVLVTELLVK